jgi:ActR/RegA family two-component response regulator
MMQPMRVLVIDDDPGTCETLKIGLTRLGGHTVVCAHEKADGIRAMEESRFDAALIDLRLALGVSGLDALRAFVQLQPGAAAYLLTAYAEADAIAEALRMGARYLPKLLHVEQLAGILSGEPVPRPADTLSALMDPVIGPSSPSPHHIALERWADLVVRGVHAAEDPRTLEIWCKAAGVSRSALEARHAAVNIGAHAAKDLTRLLWAIRTSREVGSAPADLLEADPRTIQRILAGVDPSKAGSLAAVLDAQQVITDRKALRALSLAVSRRGRCA